MTDTTKINYSQKKLVGKQHTWNNKQWFEEEDGIVLYQHAKEIWIDEVPTITPTTTTPIIRKIIGLSLVNDTTVQNRLSFSAIENSEKIRGFITPSYGINYTVKVYANGVQIPTSHPSQPLFDYTNGVLSFENTPPTGDITIDAYQYTARTFAQYLDTEDRSIARGILGLDDPHEEYIIQHNMATFDIDIVLYVYDEVNGVNYWKKDVVPMILFDENRVKLQLSEAHPIRFIIKSYETPEL